MVADSSSHDSATTENDGDDEILGETQEKRRDATWPVGRQINKKFKFTFLSQN